MTITPNQAKALAEQLLHDPDTAPGATDVSPLPRSIGSYRIRRRIASGGMGTVYEAEQQHPHRLVALKVMKHGIASRSALRRCAYEAEILGRLRHPGIAQIYEAGTDDDGSGSAPYFAMEYLPHARNLIEYADAEDFATRARLDLFARVCDAVHHGHQKGVIHRDLKPGNILVDESGRPKVIDFGVARATDADIAVTTLRTSVGELLGTLQYMSPEQCEANPDDLDIRTDVYSLGVVLYELLCGRPPYDVSDTALPKATRIIQEQAPERPSTIRRACRGDVEAIVLRALEKAPDRRYQSAADLAQDIRRHLEGRPIEARAPRPWVRAAQWVGRHPILTTAAACITIAAASIGLTFAVIWWLDRRPDEIRIAEGNRKAKLLSLGGAILYTWDARANNGISIAALLEQPPALGGEQLAVIGYSAAARVEHRGTLCAFDPRDPETLIWMARITDADIRNSPLRTSFTQDQFQVAGAIVADVFPERPGREIAVIHKDGPYSPSALCVYDLAGECLYRIWHDGPINPPFWLPGKQRLITSGLSHEDGWAQRHFEETGCRPIVVLALTPKVGHLATTWTGVSEKADTATLAWYKCVAPLALSTQFQSGSVKEPHWDEDESRYLRLDLELREEKAATVSWLMTADGRLVPDEAVPSDEYDRLLRQGHAPRPEAVRLVDAPPDEPSGPLAEPDSGG